MSNARSVTAGPLEAYCTSGSSPGVTSLHLVGPGRVGRALLRCLAGGPVRLVAVSDSRGTLRSPGGLDPRRTAELKERTGRVAPERRALSPALLRAVGADLVVDATATALHRTDWYDLLEQGVLDRGATLVLAAKDGLRARAERWTAPPLAGRVRFNAVLGGAGEDLRAELPELRSRAHTVAIGGNASTTAIVRAVEAGGSLEDGIAAAGEAGLLEADPELDLRGVDAAVKLAIVAGAVWGRSVEPATIPCDDIRDVDPEILRERARRGRTTRLIGRRDPTGRLSVRYEEVARGSLLDVPSDRVAYLYGLREGGERLHVGDGLGPDGTARALLRDVEACLQPATATAEVAR
ncbi:MAG TPA: hypothetical protein VK858_16490 [Longimicrobiales bacterium]|nr:hypothetical protein [Longimicrobiales bacterium]